VELQSRYEDLQARGIGLAVVTYDPATTLSQFAAARDITFPLLSDEGSATIREYGLLNEEMNPARAPEERRAMMQRLYGIPYPGTFMLDPEGRVTARFFEAAYQERSTVSSIAVRLGDAAPGAAQAGTRVETDHLEALAWATDDVVAPGNRLSLVVDVTPKTDMHVYAPGDHGYRVIRLRTTAPDFLRSHDVAYPSSGTYHFEPLDETVAVYEEPFRLVQDVTIPMRQDIAELAAEAGSTVRIEAVLEYQACDHEVCYLPQAIPLSWDLSWRGLIRD
jgi:peroxiredoxin